MMASGRIIVAEVLVYLLAACAVVGGALIGPEVPGTGVDLHGSLWFHWWLPHALAEGLDPRWTELFFFPLGKDLFAHTGLNLVDAALSAPFQLVFGHPGYLGPFAAAVLLANALAFRPLVAELALPARLVGCLAFALSPYALGELEHGRTAQVCLFFVPLALHQFLRAGEAVRHAVAAGVLTALTGWTYWFYGYFLALALAWVALHELLRSSDRRGLALRYLLAGAVCAAMVLPAVWPMVAAVSRGEVPLLDGGTPPAGAPVLQHVFTTLVLLLLLGWLVVGRGRMRWAPVALILVLVAAGPRVGEQVNPVYELLQQVPFAKRLLFPYRALGVAAVPVAWALASLVASAGRGRWVVAAVALAALGDAARSWLPVSAQDPNPPELLRSLERGGMVDLPIGSAGAMVAWQPALGAPLYGGMGATNPALWPDGFEERRKNGFIRALEHAASAQPPGPWERADLEQLRSEGFRWVVHQGPTRGGPRSRAATRRLRELLGEPYGREGPITVWDMAAVEGGS